MDERGPPRAIEWAFVLLGATLVIAVLVSLGGSSQALQSDQEELNLIVEKRLHPEILPRDALYGSHVIDLYTPSFIRLQRTMSRRMGGDAGAALRVLIWPVGVLYLVGHYVLFRALTGNPIAAALGAISALTVRNALGGEYWGFEGLRAIQPRSLLNGLTPVLLLVFLRWRDRRLFPLYFFGLGLLLNVHPVGAAHLAQVTGVGHLWLDRFRCRAWRHVVVGGLLFVVGALPLASQIFGNREQVAEPALLAEVRQGLGYRFPYSFYPIPIETIVSVMIHALLLIGVTAWLLRRRAVGTDLKQLLALAVIAVLLGLGGTGIIQGIGIVTNRPYVDILEMRATKLAYPILLAALATCYAYIGSLRSRWAPVVFTGLFLLSLIPPEAAIHAVSQERRDAIKRFLGARAPGGVEAVPTVSASLPLTLVEWVRTSTPPDALVFTDHNDFRTETLRSITGTAKDGGWQYLGGSRPFYAWYVYIRGVEGCRAVHGKGCWFELALHYDVDYALVDPGVEEVTPTAKFRRVWAYKEWSLWRRQPPRVAPRLPSTGVGGELEPGELKQPVCWHAIAGPGLGPRPVKSAHAVRCRAANLRDRVPRLVTPGSGRTRASSGSTALRAHPPRACRRSA